MPVGGQRLWVGGQALDHGGDLHHDVRGDLGQLAAVGDDLIARHGDGLGGNRAVRADDVADALHVVMEVIQLAADLGVQRRVGGDACQRAPASSLFDFARSAVSRKNFTLIPPYIYGLLPALRIERALMGSGNLMMGKGFLRENKARGRIAQAPGARKQVATDNHPKRMTGHDRAEAIE